jgi:antitoxin component YwqK of YwqJK toxin-antitoxin module
MKRLILLLGLLTAVVALWGQGPIQLSDIKMLNLGDGRLFATSADGEKTPIEGKHRIITGYTTEYMDAEFTKGYATGKWEYYKRNILNEVRHYVDGLPHGEYIEYYADGKTVKSRAMLINGKTDGIVTSYSQEGKKTYEKSMKNGEEDGEERRYSDDGTLLYERFYKNGKVDGKSFSIINYGDSKEYTETAWFKDGKQDGEFSAVYADGIVKSKGTYKDGHKTGLWEKFKRDGAHDGNSEVYENDKVVKRVSYYTDNSIERETLYNAEGKKHGIEKEYAFDGGYLVREQNYVNGKLTGKQMRRVSSNTGSYFEYAVYDDAGRKNGEYSEIWEETKQLKAKGQYVIDKKDGKWLYGYSNGKDPGKEEVYENGKLKSRKLFVSDMSGNYFEVYNFNDRENKDGEYLEIWEKGGKTKTKGKYENSRQQGVWTTYDVSGKPLSETVYENGHSVSTKKF